MPLSCTKPDCDGAVSLIESSDNRETYECEFGHTFTVQTPVPGAAL